VPEALLEVWLDEAVALVFFAGAVLEFVEGEPESGTALPFPPPGTHPGTRSAAVAGAGPSVTAMQPGKLGNKLPGSTCSAGRGFGAEHALS